MQNIKLPTPIIPESSIRDMTYNDAEIVRFINRHSDISKCSPENRLLFYIFSSTMFDTPDAVLSPSMTSDSKIDEYRQHIGLPSAAVTEIPCIDILRTIDDYYSLNVYIDLFRVIDTRCKRLSLLNELSAPEIVIKNEIRMLREKIDVLISGNCDPEFISLSKIKKSIIGNRLVCKS